MTGAPVPPQIPRGVRYWHGQATGRHWAMVPWPWAPSGYRLIEARTRDELADQVRQLMGHTARQHGGASRAGDGAAAVTMSPLQGGRGNRKAAAPQPSPSPGARHRRDDIG